ncbi:50S ribosomal protein L11 methyltransferase [Phytohabitans aurantiacus]|uniref:Methyltransferase n=1 Tax=Phytohabitans aurantiacus TaxID=3016789 RepID=A0ABQ5R2V6_9ACTN|nr:50S ribosomal protein L11 methyltransferase [Phytohabitans aurantiacus]GLI00558.1 methyltransferase [Phytohabitans aurantiacus]
MTASTVRTRSPGADLRFGLLRFPGVYRPQADTALLTGAAAAAPIPPGARVLDMCTGSGAVAVAAARLGAGEVTAVDVSRRAVLCVRLNAWARGLPVRARRGSLADLLAAPPWTATRDEPVRRSYDVVLANPPYVPCPSTVAPTGRERAWDAGPDGRAVLDPFCLAAPGLLSESGFVLLVHSQVSDVDRSLALLRRGGLETAVVSRLRVPFGPVMWARAAYLESTGLIRRGQRHEDLVVIRASRR